MLNWKNLIENAIYIVLIGIMMTANTYLVIGQFEGMVQTAIEQETTKIENKFETQIKKLKSRQGGTVDFTIDPKIDNKAQTNITKDSISERKGFFKRLFGRKKN